MNMTEQKIVRPLNIILPDPNRYDMHIETNGTKQQVVERPNPKGHWVLYEDYLLLKEFFEASQNLLEASGTQVQHQARIQARKT